MGVWVYAMKNSLYNRERPGMPGNGREWPGMPGNGRGWAGMPGKVWKRPGKAVFKNVLHQGFYKY